MIEDAELLRRYVETHSEEAFAELVRRRIGLVYSVALRTTRNPQHAEDVTQTVFADLVRKAKKLVNRPVLAGWLYRSARFAALGVVRAEQNRISREKEAQSMHEITAGDVTESEWEKVRPALYEVMSELNDRDRDAIILRFFDGRPFADIGKRLQLTENSARMRVDRALDKLNALLARRGIRSTTAVLSAALAHEVMATVPAGLTAAVINSSISSVGIAMAPTISLLQFMSTSKVFLGTLLAMALGHAAYQVYADRKAQTALGAANRENETLFTRLTLLQQQADEKDAAVSKLRKYLNDARSAESRRAREARIAEGNAFVARHPEVKRALTNYVRSEVDSRYRQLFHMLHLSPEQIERFKDLAASSRFNFLGPDKEMLEVTMDGATAKERERQLRALLGEDGFKQYRDVDNKDWSTVQMTTELAGSLYQASSPLSATQADQLTHLLTEHRMTVDWSSQPQYDWDAIMAKIGGILSESQLSVFDFFRVSDQLQQGMDQVRRHQVASEASRSSGK